MTNCPLIDAFFRQADVLGNDLALIEPDRETTYAELWTGAKTLAARLPRGADGSVNVAILVDSPRNALVALWAVLASGNAYVPLSTANGGTRNAEIARALAVRAVVTDWRDVGVVLDPVDGAPVVVMDGNGKADGDNAVDGGDAEEGARADGAHAASAGGDRAYILSTSGTTGQPKAVVQNRANVAFHARRYGAVVGLRRGTTHTWFSHYGFDAACMDVFGALLHGATLVCPGFGVKGLGRSAKLLSRHPPNVFHSTPTVFRALARRPGAEALFRRARFVVLGGEPAYAGDLSTFLSVCPDAATLINGLGPSECSVALQCRFTRDAARAFHADADTAAVALPVGWSVDGIDARTVPDDAEVGELQLGGDGIFEGYWADPGMTAAAFATDAGRRWYRTGDMVARDPRWGFVFRGRRDQAIKIRGQWVDLAACAATLRDDERVVDAWVAPDIDAAGDVRSLTAFVQFAGGDTLSVDTLAKLPKAAGPLKVRPVAKIPIAANGKRKAVTAESGEAAEAPAPAPAPSLLEVTVEAVLAALGAADLEIGPDEDIFDAGLDSLTFTELVLQAQHRSGRTLDLDEFLVEPTVRHFVRLLAKDS